MALFGWKVCAETDEAHLALPSKLSMGILTNQRIRDYISDSLIESGQLDLTADKIKHAVLIRTNGNNRAEFISLDVRRMWPTSFDGWEVDDNGMPNDREKPIKF